MRRTTGAAIAGILAVLGSAGCAGDPLVDALTDVRAVIPNNQSGNVSDNQIITTGRTICGLGMAADDPAIAPTYRPASSALLEHCNTWTTANTPPPADAEPSIFNGDAPAPIDPPTNAAEAGAGTGTQLSERGAWPTAVGDTIDYYGNNGTDQPIQRVTVAAIDPVNSSTCEGSGSTDDKPNNDRFVSVTMTVQNTTTYVDGPSLAFGGWEFVGENGQAYPHVDSLEAFYCAGHRAVQLPSDLGPSRRYDERTFMDLPAQAGWLILTAPAGNGNAYEYRVEAAN
jgi:hypothetical protein